MHAATIETHQALTQAAAGIARDWRGTDPMTSEEQVHAALLATDPYAVDGPEVAELLPYLVDACREAGLLAERDICPVAHTL